MKYALISDIHANLPALEAVLDHIGDQGGVGATSTWVIWWASPTKRWLYWRVLVV
jgi:hypothetical protein